MTFGKYFVNTSWKQKKYDWHEYEMLKMDIDVARHNLNIAYNNLVYRVEEDVYNSKNACVKNLIIKSDFRQRSPEIMYKGSNGFNFLKLPIIFINSSYLSSIGIYSD